MLTNPRNFLKTHAFLKDMKIFGNNMDIAMVLFGFHFGIFKVVNPVIWTVYDED